MQLGLDPIVPGEQVLPSFAVGIFLPYEPMSSTCPENPDTVSVLKPDYAEAYHNGQQFTLIEWEITVCSEKMRVSVIIFTGHLTYLQVYICTVVCIVEGLQFNITPSEDQEIC